MGGGDRGCGPAASDVLRRCFRVPAEAAGHCPGGSRISGSSPPTVPGALPSRLVSLAGGASLGPEDALGKMGGGLGTWVLGASRRSARTMRATNTLSGMSGAYRGAFCASPILASILTLEDRASKGVTLRRVTLVAGLLAAAVAFAVYFPIGWTRRRSSGSTRCRRTTCRTGTPDGAAVPLGLDRRRARDWSQPSRSAVRPIVERRACSLAKFTVLRPVIGGIAFGLVGVALPLTLFTGTDAAHDRDPTTQRRSAPVC